MDFASKDDMKHLRAATEQAFNELGEATHAAMRWPYFLIAGTERQTHIEVAAVTPTGEFTAMKIQSGEVVTMSCAQGHVDEEAAAEYSGVIGVLRDHYHGAMAA